MPDAQNHHPPLPHKKTNPSPPTSWAERVRVTDSSTRFSLEGIPRQSVGARLVIPEDLLLDTTGKWKRCMVGFFPGFRMPYHAVNTIASRVWKNKGLENVMTTTNGFMLFRFKTELEMQAVLEKGPWMFGGKTIILQQWHPHFVFDKNKISKLPVWIRLHGLPFPLWSKNGLSLVASMVGRPLSCDEQTYNCTRLDYARVCVEADAALPFIHQFEIESSLSTDPILIQVEYEWKPPRCDKCNLFGHVCTRGKSIDRTPGNISDGTPPVTETNSKTNDEAIVYSASKVGGGVTECTTSENIEVTDGVGRKIGGHVNGIGSTGFAKTKTNTSTKNTPTIDDTQLAVAVKATISDSKQIQQDKRLEQSTMPTTSLQVAAVNSRRSQQSLEQLPKQPVGICSNMLAITGSNRGDDTEDESDKDSTHDPHSVEENQLLITGFDKCVESKMATLKSSSEASTSTKDSSKEISSLPRGNPLSPFTKQVGKKKGKKLRLAKGQ
ncbi:hypothetical protein Peur_064663 [Populus x canadensis]